MPQKGNNWIIPLLLALAISAGAIWYYFFRLKPPLESSLPLTTVISKPEINENPDITYGLSSETDTGRMTVKKTAKKYVWSVTGEKVLYPGSETGRPWIWGNAVIQGMTEYIPGVPWNPNAPAVLERQQREKQYALQMEQERIMYEGR